MNVKKCIVYVQPKCECKCGSTALGETQKLEFLGHATLRSIQLSIKQISPARYMPVGWGNYTEGLRCPKCTGASHETVL